MEWVQGLDVVRWREHRLGTGGSTTIQVIKQFAKQ